jgi:hypothetical protein
LLNSFILNNNSPRQSAPSPARGNTGEDKFFKRGTRNRQLLERKILFSVADNPLLTKGDDRGI